MISPWMAFVSSGQRSCKVSSLTPYDVDRWERAAQYRLQKKRALQPIGPSKASRGNFGGSCGGRKRQWTSGNNENITRSDLLSKTCLPGHFACKRGSNSNSNLLLADPKPKSCCCWLCFRFRCCRYKSYKM